MRDRRSVRVELRTGLTTELLGRLDSDLDLVIGMHAAGSSGGVVIRREHPVWVTAAKHSPHKNTPVPLALYPDGCLFRRWATRALDEAGRAWHCAYASPSFSALESAVRAGVAVSIFKRSMLAPDLRRLRVAEGFPPVPEIEVALHRGRDLSRAGYELADYLVGCLRGSRSGRDSGPRSGRVPTSEKLA